VLAISDAQLELDRPDGKFAIAKANVAQVYYLRYKPLTDSEKYSAQKISGSIRVCGLTTSTSLPKCQCGYTIRRWWKTIALWRAKTLQRRSDFCFSGYVQSIDPSSLTLRRAGRDAQTVQISKNISVRVRTRQSAVEDIKVGDEIIACGSVENGDFVVERINLSK
jgi:hypothetical protein